MRPWIRRSLLAVVGATIALGGLAACGHRHGHQAWQNATPEERAQMRQKVIDRVAGKLDLNAEQKARLAVLADRLQEQRAALVPQGADPRAELRSFVAGEKFDRAKAQAFVSRKTEAIQSGSPQVLAALADFYDSLNPQQQAKVREYMERGRRGGWRG
jgi:protein CpxP